MDVDESGLGGTFAWCLHCRGGGVGRIALMLVVAFTLGAVPAWPCSFGLGYVDPAPTPQALVAQAETIVRARARPHDEPSSRTSRVLVLFDVLDVLKGTLPRSVLGFPGYLESVDDFNGFQVPYTGVRRGGLHGDCHASNYRANAEYLLFLKGQLPNRQTPHWAALRPTNEQVLGAADPWVAWVVDELARTAPLR